MKTKRFIQFLFFTFLSTSIIFIGCTSKGSKAIGTYVGDKGTLDLKEGGIARIDVGNKTFDAKWIFSETENSPKIEITLHNGEVEVFEQFDCKAFSYSVETSTYYLIAPINKDESFSFEANSEIDSYNRFFGNYQLTFKKDGTFEYHYESQSEFYQGVLKYWPGGIPGFGIFWPESWNDGSFHSGVAKGNYKYVNNEIELKSDSGKSMTISDFRDAICLYNPKAHTAYLLFSK